MSFETEIRASKIGFKTQEIIRKYRPDLVAKKEKSLSYLTASYTSVDPAANQYWEAALQLKNEIEFSIRTYPEDIKNKMQRWIIPTGFYK